MGTASVSLLQMGAAMGSLSAASSSSTALTANSHGRQEHSGAPPQHASGDTLPQT